MDLKEQTRFMMKLGKVCTARNCFEYEGQNLFPFVQWYVWMYLNTLTDQPRKELSINRGIRSASNSMELLLEIFLGALRRRPSEVDLLAVAHRARLEKVFTVDGLRYMQPVADYVLESLQERTKLLVIDNDRLSRSVVDLGSFIRYFRRKIKSIPSSYFFVPFRVRKGITINKKLAFYLAKFREEWYGLCEDSQFKELMSHIEDWKNGFVTDHFKRRLFEVVRFKMREIMTAEDTLRRVKPRDLLVFNEYGNMPFVYAARKQGMKSYGMAHGVIHSNHPGYIYDAGLRGKVPLPDVQFVFGDYEKRILTTESVYEEERVHVVGNPRMINNLLAAGVYDIGTIRNKLRVPRQKKILTFFSSGSYEGFDVLDKKAALFSDAAALQQEYFLVVKLHPAETDFRQYHKEARRNGFKEYMVTRDFDTYALLYTSDIVLGMISTVLSEAVAFLKNIVIYSNNVVGDQVDYVKMGVALRREDFHDLRSAIDYFTADNEFASRLRENRARFVRAFYGKIDNKPVERVLEVILNTHS